VIISPTHLGPPLHLRFRVILIGMTSKLQAATFGKLTYVLQKFQSFPGIHLGRTRACE
jgi:hypothetical protein